MGIKIFDNTSKLLMQHIRQRPNAIEFELFDSDRILLGIGFC